VTTVCVGLSTVATVCVGKCTVDTVCVGLSTVDTVCVGLCTVATVCVGMYFPREGPKCTASFLAVANRYQARYDFDHGETN